MNDQQDTREQNRTEQPVPASAPPKPSQEELEQLYLEQQRRLACPSCGEIPFLG